MAIANGGLYQLKLHSKVIHIDTKQSNKRNNQNSKSKCQDYYMK